VSRRGAAFTLVEVLVALFFMTIALTAYIALNARLAIGDQKVLDRVQNVNETQNNLVEAIGGGGTGSPMPSPSGLTEYEVSQSYTDRQGKHFISVGTMMRDPNLWW
jgi:Tfp pilus assembly protein PilV